MKPLALDLFCGLGGWTDGLLAAGFDVIGFDVERHDYGTGGYPAQLVLQDVLTLHGRQFKDAALIVASPPCQELSYMAMPWSMAKAKERDLIEGRDDQKRLTALFDACFRIQREANEAAELITCPYCAGIGGYFSFTGIWWPCCKCDGTGRIKKYIPLVVENVRGAQKWVGRSRWNYGSFHLWGDVPALMVTGTAHKQGGLKSDWFNAEACKNGAAAKYGSKSPQRKAASAAIAKIPFPLAQHIARYWKPQELAA